MSETFGVARAFTRNRSASPPATVKCRIPSHTPMSQKITRLPVADTNRKPRGPIARRAADAAIDFERAADETLARIADLVRDPRRPGKATLLPFSKSSLERRVRSENFPQPTKLGPRCTCWKLGDVRQWLAQQQGE